MSQLYEEALNAQEQGNIEQAEQLFIQLIAIAQDNDDIVLQQQSLVQLAALAHSKEDVHSAIRWQKKNYNLTKKHNSKQASRVCLDISITFLDAGELSESKIWSKKALERSEADWDKEVMAESQLLLGMAFFREERPEDARILFRRANVIFEELKDDEGVFKSLFHMGLVCHQMADFARARSIFITCLEKVPEEAIPLVADLHLRLTVISLELGYHIDALFHALASLGRYRRLGSDRQDRVWREIFRLRTFFSPEEYATQIKSHLNEEGYKKFKAMSEAVEMRFQKDIQEAEAQREEEAKIRQQKEDEQARKEAFFAYQKKQERDRQEAEAITAPITNHNIPVFVQETNEEMEENLRVPNITPEAKPMVIEIEVFEQEVQDDSVETEITWREDLVHTQEDKQTKNIVLLFIGVFLFVFGSLYFLSFLQS